MQLDHSIEKGIIYLIPKANMEVIYMMLVIELIDAFLIIGSASGLAQLKS